MIKNLEIARNNDTRSIKRCILSPLGDVQYSFTENCKTGDMKDWGMGIERFDDELKIFIGGVITRDHVIELRDFLDEWCNKKCTTGKR